MKKKFTKKRLEENLQKNLINKKQKRILISEKGRLFICVFFNLKKIFNLYNLILLFLIFLITFLIELYLIQKYQTDLFKTLR